MKTAEKRAWVFGSLLFFSVQLWHTVYDQNNWPFCSYNVFSYVRPKQSQTLKVRLYEREGEPLLVDVWEVLPLEFFRSISVMREVFIDGHERDVQDALAVTLLRGLNQSPWGGFDQTYPSVRSSSRFVGFELLRVEVDLRGASIAIGGETVLYSYRGRP